MVVIAATLGSAAAMAADDWTLTTSDLRSRIVQLRGFDQSGVAITLATTQPATIRLDEFLSLTRSIAAATAARWSVQLQNGDVFAGEPESLDGETLHWRESLMGSIDLPMSSVVSLCRIGEPSLSPLAKKPANLDDIVKLTNGDTLHGVVADLNARGVSVQRTDGSVSPVPIDSIAQVQFAATAATSTSPSESSNPSFRITLSDGSTFSSVHLQIQSPTLSTTFNGSAKQLPLEIVQSVEQIDGPVTWLSDRAPAEDVQIPMLGPPRPTRFNRSVSGEPLRFGKRIFIHGIGVHAYSKLTWPIGDGEQAFRTQFAIDGDLPLADLTVRIRLDGQVASETRDVRAGQLSPVIFLDVRGKHTITLEVEDTANDDVQARLNWLEPVLLRNLPESMGTIDADVSKSGGR